MIAIVSNIAFLHSYGRAATARAFAACYCKKRRTSQRLISTCSAVLLVLASSARAAAIDETDRPEESSTVSTLKFLAGAGLALGAHESGHLVFDVAFGAEPHLIKVDFGGVPFFAVAHKAGVSPRREFAISSAGFWVQHGTDEWLLVRHPDLRNERAPFLKGVLAFNILTSVGYSFAAFAKAGPYERDTRGMGDAIGVDERGIGALILAPAVLDAYRYYRPRSAVAKWLSRAVKAGGVLLILK